MRAAASEVIFAVRLEPADRRSIGQNLFVMYGAQPNAGKRPNPLRRLDTNAWLNFSVPFDTNTPPAASA
ncbi:MAG: hypothetical protein ABI885_15255 [Gammaproteobacteria bacterium]